MGARRVTQGDILVNPPPWVLPSPGTFWKPPGAALEPSHQWKEDWAGASENKESRAGNGSGNSLGGRVCVVGRGGGRGS